MSARRDEMMRKIQLSKEKGKGQKRKLSDIDRTDFIPGPSEKAKGVSIKEHLRLPLPPSSLQEELFDLAMIDPASPEKQTGNNIESVNPEIPLIMEESDVEKETESTALVRRRKSRSKPNPTSAERHAPLESRNVGRQTRSSSKKCLSLGPSLRPRYTKAQWLGDEPIPDSQFLGVPLLPEPTASATQPLFPESPERTVPNPGAQSCRNFEVAKKLNENSVLPEDLKSIASLSDDDYERTFHCTGALFRTVNMDVFGRYKQAKAAYTEEKETRIKYVKLNKDKNTEITNLKAQVKELKLENERLQTDTAIADSKATTERRRAEDLNEELKVQKALLESAELALKKAEEEKKCYGALEEKYASLQVSMGVLDTKLTTEKEEREKWKNLYEQRVKDDKQVIADFLKSDYYQDNFAIIQTYNFREAQTKTVDICVEVDPSLNVDHEKIKEIYDPRAQQEYSEMCDLFNRGPDLRVHLGMIEDPNALPSSSGANKEQETIVPEPTLLENSSDPSAPDPTNAEKEKHHPEP